MDDLGTWLAAQWAHFSAWTERPLSNGTLLWVGVALAWQMWGGTNRTVDAIGNMTEELAQRMPPRGHFHRD